MVWLPVDGSTVGTRVAKSRVWNSMVVDARVDYGHACS